MGIRLKDFTPLGPLANYNCFNLCVVSVLQNTHVRSISPDVFEAGCFYAGTVYPGPNRPARLTASYWMDFYQPLPIRAGGIHQGLLESNFGVKIVRLKIDERGDFLSSLEERLEKKQPAIIACNAFYLPYGKDYLKNPGGFFKNYHYLVVYGVDRASDEAWVYDPVIENYVGAMPLKLLLRSMLHPASIKDFNGAHNLVDLAFGGCDTAGLDRRAAETFLYEFSRGSGIGMSGRISLFWEDLARIYAQVNVEHQSMLLEFGYFVLHAIAFNRGHGYALLNRCFEKGHTSGARSDVKLLQQSVERTAARSYAIYLESRRKSRGVALESLLEGVDHWLLREEQILGRLYDETAH